MKPGRDFNRFDVVQAHYWYCTYYHGGMRSKEYARLCSMQRYYKTGYSERMPSTSASATIYNRLQYMAGHPVTEWSYTSDDEVIWHHAD